MSRATAFRSFLFMFCPCHIVGNEIDFTSRYLPSMQEFNLSTIWLAGTILYTIRCTNVGSVRFPNIPISPMSVKSEWSTPIIIVSVKVVGVLKLNLDTIWLFHLLPNSHPPAGAAATPSYTLISFLTVALSLNENVPFVAASSVSSPSVLKL